MTHQAPSVQAKRWSAALRRRGLRLLVAFLPMLLALLHASGAWRMPVLDRLDQIIYDIRLRATMPRDRSRQSRYMEETFTSNIFSQWSSVDS